MYSSPESFSGHFAIAVADRLPRGFGFHAAAAGLGDGKVAIDNRNELHFANGRPAHQREKTLVRIGVIFPYHDQ